MAKLEKNDFWKNYGLSIFLVALIIIALIFIETQLPSESSKSENPPISPKAEIAANSVVYSASREVLTLDAIITLTNNARAQNGLPPLKENQLLDSIATSRAQDMLDKQYFAHVSPTGQQASDIAQSIGYHYKIIAENIGSGDFYTNQKIVDGWMQSPGHRSNILSTEVEEIGAAVLKGKMKGADTYITVQIFGLQSLPVSQKICVAPSKNLLDDINLKKAELDSLKSQLDRLKNELDTERESIETDRRNIDGDNQKIEKFNVRIKTFNEKSGWYNKLVEEAKAKSGVISSMVKEYNKTLQDYNDCETSH
jgi:uncharacterized protein YkwD